MPDVITTSATFPVEATQPSASTANGTSNCGPVDWVELVRGTLLFAILGGAFWVEWIAIRSLAIFVSRFVGG